MEAKPYRLSVTDSSGRPTSRWSWAGLWLWLAAPALFALAAFLALPMLFESTPEDRASAVQSSWPLMTATAAAGVGSAVAGWACLHRVLR